MLNRWRGSPFNAPFWYRNYDTRTKRFGARNGAYPALQAWVGEHLSSPLPSTDQQKRTNHHCFLQKLARSFTASKSAPAKEWANLKHKDVASVRVFIPGEFSVFKPSCFPVKHNRWVVRISPGRIFLSQALLGTCNFSFFCGVGGGGG